MRVYSVLLLLVLIPALMVIGTPTTAQVVTTATPTPNGVIIIATAIPGSTAVPTQSNGCYRPLALTVGGDALLRGGVNLRSAPSLSAPLVNYYPSQVELHLDGGPVCANGFNWWQVSGMGEPGWVVEGKPAPVGFYYLQPFANPNTTNCAAPLNTIQVGGMLQTLSGLRLRQTPENSALVVTTAQPGTRLPVIGGPQCFEGFNWWEVRAQYGSSSTLVTAWIAEGYPGLYFVEELSANGQAQAAPTAACLTPLRLHAGTRAAVTYTDGVPRSLRAAPSTAAAVVASLLDGIEFEVINGDSVCVDNYNWWQVQIVATGLTGWLAEGRPGNYWFDVLIN